MIVALAWLFHNAAAHPIVGLLHFAGDLALVLHVPDLALRLWRAGDAVHDFTLPRSPAANMVG